MITTLITLTGAFSVATPAVHGLTALIEALTGLTVASGILICTISMTARKVRTELKRWHTPSKRCGTNPKTKILRRTISR